MQLWRLDCGTLWVANLDEYSDTRAYVGRSKRFVASCYLIRHGETYLLWDAGLPKTDLRSPLKEGGPDAESLDATIVDQLARIGVTPARISLLGISHYHFDHTGQAADFPQAKLLMGRADLEALRQPGKSERAKPLAHWIDGDGSVDAVDGDRDVFGDGSVVMLDLPGHTPGHHGLLVQLQHRGAVLLSGDVAHFRENLESQGVPSFNTDRAQSLSSLDRFAKLARNLHATVVIQHEEKDVAKLPPFPTAAD
ncbi:MAG: N-acyl homoserine lactonase family protein [Luteimonas sp.]